MITHPVTEDNAEVIAATALLKTGSTTVSSITLDGGTASAGATVIFDDSTDGSGDEIWVLRASQYGSASISFVKPINFSTGCYITLTGTSSKVAIAYS